MNKYFDIKDSLYEITKKYPETLDLFISIGFENMKDEKKREVIGKSISLEMALLTKKINVNTFTERLVEIIEEKNNAVDQALIQKAKKLKVMLKLMGYYLVL